MTDPYQNRRPCFLFACFLSIASHAACLPTDCVNTDAVCHPALSLIYTHGVCALDRHQIIQPENFAAVQAELQAQAALGSRGTALLSTIPAPQTGTGKWAGGTLAPNGLIYGMPRNSDDVLVIDPNTNAATTIPTGTTGGLKWSGGVLASNGMIYAIPQNSNDVLVIDPNTNTASTIPTGTASTRKWRGSGLQWHHLRDSRRQQ